MPEKSRASRRQEEAAVTGPTSENSRQGQTRAAPSGQPRSGDIEERLAKTRQELDQSLKISRSLARNCARAEQELRRSEESLGLVLRYGSDLVFRLSRDGKFLELSPALQELLGYSPAMMGGRSLQNFVVREHHEALGRYFQNVLRGSCSDGLLLQLLHQDRSLRLFEMHCRAVPHPQTNALEILGIARPPRASEGATLSPQDLASSLAHELNQPLTALAIAARACSRLARAPEMDTKELIQAIDGLAAQAERAGELVRRMRQLAARGAPRWSVASLGDLLKGALKLLEGDLERERITTRLNVPEGIPKIRVDDVQIEQVLVNLIRNAIEAMSDMPADERILTLAVLPRDSEVVLTITDSGRGLSPAVAERLFQPYQTTKPQGMGLGLAVSRAILQAHAGRLWVEPAPGRGTTFCIALPLAS
jgi:PAS domain S-box-containing protein